jgi:hypothetical protein
MEAEESTMLGAVIRQQLLKTQQTSGCSDLLSV